MTPSSPQTLILVPHRSAFATLVPCDGKMAPVDQASGPCAMMSPERSGQEEKAVLCTALQGRSDSHTTVSSKGQK